MSDSQNSKTSCHGALRQTRASRTRGAISIEYILILALVVIPIALLTPLILQMIANYTCRIGIIIRLPFG